MATANLTRPCSFVFLRSGDRVLVSEMMDEADGVFYRPPGGGIEFGEHSRVAASRELHEEFGLELHPEDLSLLGVIENLFQFRGGPHHEICFVYEARVAGDVLGRLDGVEVRGLAPGDAEVAKVFTLRALLELDPLYPAGVRAFLS